MPHHKLATTPSGALIDALIAMQNMDGPKLGDAHWMFVTNSGASQPQHEQSPYTDEIVIEWAGMTHRVVAEVHMSLPHGLYVKGKIMKGLAAAINEGVVRIGLNGQQMMIDTVGISVRVATSKRGLELPFGATEADLLPHLSAHDRKELMDWGYGPEAEAVNAKWEKAINSAYTEIEWTNIPRQQFVNAMWALLPEPHVIDDDDANVIAIPTPQPKIPTV